MKTTVQEIDGKLVATLCGELDTAAAPEAEVALRPLLQAQGKDIVIDCTDLEYIASSGLRLLLSRNKLLPAKIRIPMISLSAF